MVLVHVQPKKGQLQGHHFLVKNLIIMSTQRRTKSQVRNKNATSKEETKAKLELFKQMGIYKKDMQTNVSFQMLELLQRFVALFLNEFWYPFSFVNHT